MSVFCFLRRGGTGSIARSRLKLLLVSDKADCSPEMMRVIESDLIHVVSKYMEIDKEKVQLKVECPSGGPGGRQPLWVLCAAIPVRAIPNKGIY